MVSARKEVEHRDTNQLLGGSSASAILLRSVSTSVYARDPSTES